GQVRQDGRGVGEGHGPPGDQTDRDDVERRCIDGVVVREEHVGCNAWLFPPLHLGIGGLLQAREESIELRLYVPGVTRGLTPTLLLGLREGGAELRAARREAGDQRGVVRRKLLARGLRGAREP